MMAEEEPLALSGEYWSCWGLAFPAFKPQLRACQKLTFLRIFWTTRFPEDAPGQMTNEVELRGVCL